MFIIVCSLPTFPALRLISVFYAPVVNAQNSRHKARQFGMEGVPNLRIYFQNHAQGSFLLVRPANETHACDPKSIHTLNKVVDQIQMFGTIDFKKYFIIMFYTFGVTVVQEILEITTLLIINFDEALPAFVLPYHSLLYQK